MKQSKLQASGYQFGDRTWQEEWPIEVNTVWAFYGYLYGKGKEEKEPELFFVEVKEIRNGFCYICNGHFLFKSERVIGKWKKVEITLPPKEE